ncbi:MAG: hypothetical protein IPO39_04510 [Bacteroidetes bacterium]|nr:hypothetical protein [Bacteroidota bacterium]MBK9541755.1 hypothetical protein [Bacteroidota bacterium]MBP6402210.1 hypothetical protein [Bacteroidia bacterium]
MPWTNKKFPESMKKLTAEVRNKAISIGNALLKENKKMKEGIAIATAIKNAKAFVAKKTKKKSPLKKQVKATVKKKIKVAVKKKSKVIAAKKSKPVNSKKIKKSASKNATGSLMIKSKKSTAKKVKNKVSSESKTKLNKSKDKVQNLKKSAPAIAPKKKSKKIASLKFAEPTKEQFLKTPPAKKINPTIENIDLTVSEPTVPEIILHGEDLNFIPETGDASPLTPVEEHQIENIFHHKEEFAMHQENQKVKEAMSSRKNTARFFRKRGRR